MRRLRAFGRFWWSFVIGDDPVAAACIALAVAATAILVHGGVNAWWVMPVAFAGVLSLSLRRARR